MAIDMRVFPLRLQRDLYARLKSVSEDDKRSMNTWAAIALEKEINRYESAAIIEEIELKPVEEND